MEFQLNDCFIALTLLEKSDHRVHRDHFSSAIRETKLFLFLKERSVVFGFGTFVPHSGTLSLSDRESETMCNIKHLHKGTVTFLGDKGLSLYT